MTRKLRSHVAFRFHGIWLDLEVFYYSRNPEPENKYTDDCEICKIWNGNTEVEAPSEELTTRIIRELGETK